MLISVFFSIFFLQNSIRHNLSLHNRFMRVQNEGTGKSSWWMLNPDAKPGNYIVILLDYKRISNNSKLDEKNGVYVVHEQVREKIENPSHSIESTSQLVQ